MDTVPEVYIIESLHREDNQEGRVDGEVISKILKMGGRNPKYKYIQSRNELIESLDDFDNLRYRYLHLSCHGNDEGLVFEYGEEPFNQFQFLIRDKLEGKRVFVSACEVVNHHDHSLANAILRDTGCISLIGSYETINFDDSALLWSTFYYLCYKNQVDPITIKRDKITSTLIDLTKLFQINLNYYSYSRSKGISLLQLQHGKKFVL